MCLSGYRETHPGQGRQTEELQVSEGGRGGVLQTDVTATLPSKKFDREI